MQWLIFTLYKGKVELQDVAKQIYNTLKIINIEIAVKINCKYVISKFAYVVANANGTNKINVIKAIYGLFNIIFLSTCKNLMKIVWKRKLQYNNLKLK